MHWSGGPLSWKPIQSHLWKIASFLKHDPGPTFSRFLPSTPPHSADLSSSSWDPQGHGMHLVYSNSETSLYKTLSVTMNSIPLLCSEPPHFYVLTKPLSSQVPTWPYLSNITHPANLIWLKNKPWLFTRLCSTNSKHTQLPLPHWKAVLCSWFFTSKSRILSYQRPNSANYTFLLFLKCIIFCPLLLPSHWSQPQ